ncbi:DUF1636 family protein [Varunaivibrio sulfuroxidans]|uniref:Putative metal-binding protein n=1 Tax=Varunaivibrio sulfuroxidans TaxID=1773489 RepID=A0A4R3JHL7_9PROT|nr:DUF1636 family protein [Varunaivibrio sulfuroxidans]TCS64756.1 putative metal-binding protein [Varunaivibrio sulfuroxidans]WES29939.1 DUF1636 family protein [Varunaivibrio sulfuroxidans]
MSPAALHVCGQCRVREKAGARGVSSGADPLRMRIESLLRRSELNEEIQISPQTCLGNCKRALRASVAAPGRWSWLIGDITDAQDCDELLVFIRQWLAAPQGLIAKQDRSAWLITHALGRLPPVG